MSTYLDEMLTPSPMAPQPPLPVGGVVDPLDRLFYEMGVKPEERQRAGIVQSVVRGMSRGAFEPFEFIPAVHERLEAARAREAEKPSNKLGYGFGYLGGWLVPGNPALKLGGKVVTATKLANVGLRAGELTMIGRGIKGGIAGGLMSMGKSVEEDESRFVETMKEAALFAGGDMFLEPVLKAALGATIFRKAAGLVDDVPLTPDEDTVVKIAGRGYVENPSEAGVYGRALSVIDDLGPFGPDTREVAAHKLNLQLGLEDLGVKELRPGQIKLMPNVGIDLTELSDIMKRAGINHRIINRTAIEKVKGAAKGEAGKSILRRDIIMGLAEDNDLLDDAHKQLLKYGVIRGQEVLYGGKKWIVDGISKNRSHIMGRAADALGGDKTPIPINKAHFLNFIRPPLDKAKVPEANRLWADFVTKHGAFPFTQTVGTLDGREVTMGFHGTVSKFLDEKGIKDAATRQAVRRYFASQQKSALKEIDPDMHALVTHMSGMKHVDNRPHAGGLRDQAIQKGFLLDAVPSPTSHPDGRTAWMTRLRDIEYGEEHLFADDETAEAFLKEYTKDMKSMVDESASPIALEAVTPPNGGGVGVQVPYNGMHPQKSPRVPWHVSAFWHATPRLHNIRRVDDVNLRELGTEGYIPTWPVMNKVMQQSAIMRNKSHPFIKKFTKIRGGTGAKTNVRPENFIKFVDMFEQPRSEWAGYAAKHGLNEKELKAASEYRDWMNEVFEDLRTNKVVDITGDEFVETLLPHMRRSSEVNWVKSVKEEAKRKGVKINDDTLNWLKSMERTGRSNSHEPDPWMLGLRILRGGMFQAHVGESYKAAYEHLNTLRQAEKTSRSDMSIVAKSLEDYLSMVHGDIPEVYETVNVMFNDIFRQLGMDKQIPPRMMDKVISSYVALNYSAFMGFRPGLALRNMTQTMVLLGVTGPKYLAHGFKSLAAASEKSVFWKEAIDDGVIIENMIPMPMGEVMDFFATTPSSKRLAGAMTGTANTLQKIARVGGSLFQTADELTRFVGYAAQRKRGLDALNKWRGIEGKAGHGDLKKFNYEAGLDWFGETVTQEFHKKLAQDPMKAVRWLAKQVTDDTMFMYQQGAGPAWASHGWGKLGGMYGTWPVWFGSMFQQAARRATKSPKDAARFVTGMVAMHTAIVQGGQAVGIDTSRWTGISSFRWTGGPMVDLFADVRDVVGGITAEGEPTSKRSIALAKYGLEHTGRPFPLPNISMDDETPWRLLNAPAMLTPGAYLLKDMIKAGITPMSSVEQQAQPTEDKLRRLLSLPPIVVGSAWPEASWEK